MKVVVSLGRNSSDFWAKKKLIAPVHRASCEHLRNLFGKGRCANQLVSELLIQRKPVTWEKAPMFNKDSGIQAVETTPGSILSKLNTKTSLANVLKGFSETNEDSESEGEQEYELPDIGGASNVDTRRFFRDLEAELITDDSSEAELCPGFDLPSLSSGESLHPKKPITARQNPDSVSVIDISSYSLKLNNDGVALKGSDGIIFENPACRASPVSAKNSEKSSRVSTKLEVSNSFPEGYVNVPPPALKNTISPQDQKHSASKVSKTTVQSVQATLQSRKTSQQLKLLKHLSPQYKEKVAYTRAG